MAQFPPTALASFAGGVLVATGSTLHYHPSGGDAASAAPAATSASTQVSGLVRKLVLSDNGAIAVSAGDDKTLNVWDVVGGEIRLRSTRATSKRVADMSFGPDIASGLIVTDKVGDVFQYPLEPREITNQASSFAIASDPSVNPAADLLLGHVSVVPAQALSVDGKYLITADRDEHIRVSRYPACYVIERYLFGSEGFVSALHIPASKPSLLLSGGGEPTLQIWNWAAGTLERRVNVWDAVLPHRKVRPPARKLKSKRRVAATPSDAASNADDFYTAPEGFMYPAGRGVVVESISSVVVNGKTVVLFFAEGCAAVHAFVLAEDESETVVHTVPFDLPVLAFTTLPSSEGTNILVALDTSFGITKSTTPEEAAELSARPGLAAVSVGADGSLSISTDAAAVKAVTSLTASIKAGAEGNPSPAQLASLALYPNLTLLPRWPGFEEDEALAGPEAEVAEGAGSASGSGSGAVNNKILGRLKAQGADVTGLMSKKRRKGRNGAPVKEESVAETEGAPEAPAEGQGNGEEASLNA